MHLARSAELAVENDSSTVEYDHFVQYAAQPVKNEFDWRLLQVNILDNQYFQNYKNNFIITRNSPQRKATTTS